jgi:sec-independent protein translocase protein TatB
VINMPGGPEIVVIMLLALIVLGPDQLPKAMRTFGNVMAEIRKVSSSFQAEMRSAIDTIEATAKPSTGSGASGSTATSGAVETTATEAGVEEVVARNTDAPTSTPTTDSTAASAPDADRPRIDPADRAAG